MVAPHVFSLLTAIPFVSVSGLLLLVWSLLINYRATEVVHELPWQRAIWVALAPVAILLLLAFFVSFLIGSGLVIGGAHERTWPGLVDRRRRWLVAHDATGE